MAFPDWAPAILVEQYTQLLSEINLHQALVLRDEKEALVEDLQPAEESRPSPPSAQLEVEENVLFRLLTHPDMRSTWAKLSRLSTQLPFVTEPIRALWDEVKYALRDFRILTTHPQTPAERRKSLLSVVSKVKALQQAISADPFAKAYAKKLMAIHLTRKNLNYRRDEGEIPPEYEEERIGLALSVDCRERFHNEEIRDYDPENFHWDEAPLMYRLAYWAKQAQDTDLDDLLQHMAETLEAESHLSPDIKQPGRGDQALKAFLIRRVSSVLRSLYGKPLDEIAAQIITVVLNLATPLTRDDIRPYLAPPGRKLRKFT